MRKILAIAGLNLRRSLRDRTNIFFVFLFPIGLIFILGLSFGSSDAPRLGVTAPGDDPLAGRLVAALEASSDLEVERVEREAVLRERVERGVLGAGVVVPQGFSESLAAGMAVELSYLATPGGIGSQLQLPVAAAVSEVSKPVRAAGFVAGRTGSSFEEALERVDDLSAASVGSRVRHERLGGSLFGEVVDSFGIAAASQLVLFMFLIGLTGSAEMIQIRQLGVGRRMLSTPTTSFAIVVGEALGRFVIALFQGLYIMVATWLLFGVGWGDPGGPSFCWPCSRP